MVALETPAAQIGISAPAFDLPATDGKRYRQTDIMGRNGMLIMFICNHCPYVQKQLDRMILLARDLQGIGVGVAAISANDAAEYPEDSFANMKKLAEEKRFPFPYLYDESQEVARAYGAVCTPDFFGYNAAAELRYRGRLDSSWTGLAQPNPELWLAMKEIAATGSTARPQNPSIGCSIKWRR